MGTAPRGLSIACRAYRAYGASACGAVLGCALALGCATPSIPTDDLAVPLPDRVSAAPTSDAGLGSPDGSKEASAPQTEGGAQVDAAPPSTLCQAPDLALCFAFEGAVVDGSPSALAPSEISGVTFVPGKEGQAASLGAASAIRFAPSAVFEVTAATIEAWIKLTAAPAIDAVVFDDDGRFSLTVLADGTVLCKSSGGAVSGGTVNVGVWAHVACVVDGTRVHVYLDGLELAAGPGSIVSNPTLTAALGGNAPSGEPFVGAIDSFRFFRVARTTAEIAAAAK